MSKGPYEAVEIKDVDVEYLAQRFDYQQLRVGFDAAKEVHYGCLMGPHWEDYYIFQFHARDDLDRLIELLESLPADEITGIIEPSGSYHEPLRKRLEESGYEVERMGTRKCIRAADLFDDVPSLHDGKSAYLIARLQLLEVSEKWRALTDRERKVRSILREMRDAEQELKRKTGRMENELARFWPEVTTVLKLGSATLQKLIGEFGSAQAVAAEPERAGKLMEKASRGKLGAERIEAVLESARQTSGLEPIARERAEMQGLGKKMYRAAREVRACRNELDEVIDEAEDQAGKEQTEVGRLRQFGGPKLAGALVGLMGSASEYASASQYEKGAGLNLKEKSSGKRKGQLAITKRGPGTVRHYLYLLACRMVQSGPRGCRYVRAWYTERLRRNGGNRTKGLVAVMRKLIKAIYHIGRGATYDGTELFDVSRLDVARPE